MSLFGDKLKKITLKEILSFIIILFLIQWLFATLNIIQIGSVGIYIFIIFYFFLKLRKDFSTIGEDILQLFNSKLLSIIILVVVLNIFFSYGMLYLSDFALKSVPNDFNLINQSLLSGSLISTIIISPISEELLFRGVFLNRLKLAVPTVFAVLISSMLFASLHSFGAIFSAFVFAVCLSILYLKTDNIVVPIFAHFLNNLFAEILVILDTNNILFSDPLVMAVISVLAAVSFVLIVMSAIPELKNINNNSL